MTRQTPPMESWPVFVSDLQIARHFSCGRIRSGLAAATPSPFEPLKEVGSVGIAPRANQETDCEDGGSSNKGPHGQPAAGTREDRKSIVEMESQSSRVLAFVHGAIRPLTATWALFTQIQPELTIAR